MIDLKTIITVAILAIVTLLLIKKLFKLAVIGLGIVIIISVTSKAYALNPEDSTDIDRDAAWGSVLKDYLVDWDNNPVVTDADLLDFKLVVHDKKNVDSVKLISTTKGPNGSKSSMGQRYIAVEITLATPDVSSRKEFYVDYTVKVRSDIENEDDDNILEKNDELDGYWEGKGYYEGKTVSTSVRVKEDDTQFVYDSADNTVKTVITTDNDFKYAIEWTTSEDTQKLKYTTDIEDSTLEDDLIDCFKQKTEGKDYSYIKFNYKPKFRNLGRLLIKADREGYLYEIKNGEHMLMEGQFYSKDNRAQMVDTKELTEYLFVFNQLGTYDEQEEEELQQVEQKVVEEVKEPTIRSGSTEYRVVYKNSSGIESKDSNPYLTNWISQSNNTYEGIDLEEDEYIPQEIPIKEKQTELEEDTIKPEVKEEKGFLEGLAEKVKNIIGLS